MAIINVQKPKKETINSSEQQLSQKFTNQIVETGTYVFSDIWFLDSHHFYLFVTNALKTLRQLVWRMLLSSKENALD